jgi:hypothetical protein
MSTQKKTQAVTLTPAIKLTISNDQRTIVKENVEIEGDNMVIIMPHYKCLTFKKRLYWVAQILYRHWS